MNCFNIRELQSVLKRRFFVDLISSHDYRGLLTNSMIGLRFKLNSSNLIDPDTLIFHNFGLKKLELNKFNQLDVNSHELKDLSRNTLVNFIDYELLANKAQLLMKAKIKDSALIFYFSNLKNDLGILAGFF
jgi:hypothetical protein